MEDAISAIAHWKASIDDYSTLLSGIGDNYTCQLLNALLYTDDAVLVEDVSRLREHLWECLHSVSWKDVEIVYRDLYSSVTVLLVSLQLSSTDLDRLSKLCDLGLLLGNGPDCARLHLLLSQIDSRRRHCSQEKKQKLNHVPSSQTQIALPPVLIDRIIPVDTVSSPGLVTFLQQYLEPQRPVVLRNVMEDWSAMTKWMDLEYFIEVGGHRTVPIEMGSSYLGSDCGSKLLTLKEFILKFIVSNDGNSVGYLAQHQLLKQIPDLQKDIVIPDYCALLLDIDEKSPTREAEDVKVQVWLGPVGTLSPLHHDCYYNLLSQVAGYKYIRLYHPDQSSKLHPMPGVMNNNSLVDLTSLESIASYPSVRDAVYSEYVLGPGEMLFIPRWHWHLVIAIDETTALAWRKQHLGEERVAGQNNNRPQFSVSVSLWWGSSLEKTE